MAKTSIADLITRIKLKADYNVTDTDLDAFIVDEINDALKFVKQKLMEEGIYKDITKSASIKTTEDQAYIDPNIARIVGDTASFTAVAGDKITVSIDGTDYTTAALTGAVLVATVVTAINLATVAIGDVASESDDGYLVITSLSSGSTSSVTISDNAGTGAARLFTVEAERTQTALYDIDEVLAVTERTNDQPITFLPYDELISMYPDPTAAYSTTPNFWSLLVDKFYFGPTPSSNILIYIDYIFQITTVTSTSTSPLNDKYDPLIVALGVKGVAELLEPANANRIKAANTNVEFWTTQLITKASRNIGQVRATASRKEVSHPGPRKAIA